MQPTWSGRRRAAPCTRHRRAESGPSNPIRPGARGGAKPFGTRSRLAAGAGGLRFGRTVQSECLVAYALAAQLDHRGVLSRVTDHGHRILAALHLLDLAQEQRTEENDAAIGALQVLGSPVRDGSLAYPGCPVLPRDHIGDDPTLRVVRQLGANDADSIGWCVAGLAGRAGVGVVQCVLIVDGHADLKGCPAAISL